MAVPKHLFIDTSILDGCSYNFESAAVKPIVDVARDKGIVLLLPDAIEQEMLRHIKGRSDEVLKALTAAQQRAPFLSKWKDWPLKGRGDFFLSWQLSKIATDELKAFFALFEVIRLKVSDVDLNEVMGWYEKGAPPFGKGKKKAEFPDAFALQSLLKHCRSTGNAVAVVSLDNDFSAACALYESLFHYKSIGSYVESLLLSDEHVAQVKEILDFNSEMISGWLRDEFSGLRFFPTDEESAELEDPEVDDVEFRDLSIFGVGDGEASVCFEAEIAFTISSAYDEYEPFAVRGEEEEWAPVTKRERISRYTTVTGTAKLRVNPDWTDFEDVDLLHLDDEQVGVEAKHDRW